MAQTKNRLTLVLSLSVVAGFLLTSLASYYVSLASLRKQIVAHELPLTRDNVYSGIQRDLLLPVFLSSLMAHDTFVRDWVAAGERDPERMISYLKEIQREYGTLTTFFVSEATRTYYQADRVLKTVKEADERDRWYFRVRAMDAPYEINLDPDMAHGDAMAIFINYRVHDLAGKYIGATGVGLRVGAVRKALARCQEEHGCTVFFADREGKVVLQGADTPLKFDNIRQIPGCDGIADQILAEVGEPLRYTSEEGMVHVNTRFIDELGWYLIALQPETRRLQGIQRALYANLGVCAVITALVLLLANRTIAAYRRRIETLATTDELTGLHNRRAFDILFDATIRDCARRGTKCSLVLFDIDWFKRTNDMHGHGAGDVVLQHVARATCEAVRSSDAVCRWGGDEFAVVLRDCGQDDAVATAEEVRRVIAGMEAAHGDFSVRVTVSLGVAEVVAGEAEDAALRRADRALYRAKGNGRNRTEAAVRSEA